MEKSVGLAWTREERDAGAANTRALTAAGRLRTRLHDTVKVPDYSAVPSGFADERSRRAAAIAPTQT